MRAVLVYGKHGCTDNRWIDEGDGRDLHDNKMRWRLVEKGACAGVGSPEVFSKPPIGPEFKARADRKSAAYTEYVSNAEIRFERGF